MTISSFIHSTSLEAYEGIISIGKILNQKDREKMLIYLSGQGAAKRKYGPIDYFLNPTSIGDYEEAEGVYFRIETTTPYEYIKFPGQVHFIFTDKLLNQFPNWIINSTENFGFQIDQHGKGNYSQMSGEFGTSWVKSITKDGIKTLDENSELVINNSVDLKNLKMIVFNTKDLFLKSTKLPNIKYVYGSRFS